MSLQDLAGYLDTSHTNISYYENGKRNIPSSIINKAAALFGVDGYDLYEEDAAQQKANVAFAFRADELTVDDLNEIARFRTVVRNYVNMKNIIKREAETEKEDNS